MLDVFLQYLDLIVLLITLMVAYFVGSFLERRHFASLKKRETAFKKMPVINFDSIPNTWQVTSSELVQGNVVISVDYFKRIIAGMRMFFGGRVKTYEPLLDRARREALMRMREQAYAKGCHAIINVRLETSRLAASDKREQSTAGVEILAFGTALRIAT